METVKHTPGPWYVHDETSYDELHEKHIGTFDIRNKQKGDLNQGYWIADVKPYETKGFTGREVAIANAKLIALAPDMYEIVKELYEFSMSKGVRGAIFPKLHAVMTKINS